MREEKENKTNNVKMAKDELQVKIEFIARIVTTIYLFFRWNCFWSFLSSLLKKLRRHQLDTFRDWISSEKNIKLKMQKKTRI